jgi:hypothetical protein
LEDPAPAGGAEPLAPLENLAELGEAERASEREGEQDGGEFGIEHGGLDYATRA